MRSRSLRVAAWRMRSHRVGMKSLSMASEARNVGARHASRTHVHAAPLRAPLERRHSLAGVEDAVRIEGALHVVEGGDLGRAELNAHLPQLLDAHAMLAGDRAADFDAQLE